VIASLRTEFRTSEMLSLTWGDVAFGRRVITVRAVWVKNSKSHSMPMNEVLTTTLQAVRMSIAAAGPVFWTL
jgi:integrase